MNVRLAGFPFRGDVLYEHELPVPVPAPVLTLRFFYSESGVSYQVHHQVWGPGQFTGITNTSSSAFGVKHTVPGFLF